MERLIMKEEMNFMDMLQNVLGKKGIFSIIKRMS